MEAQAEEPPMSDKQRKRQFITSVVFDLPAGMAQGSPEEKSTAGRRTTAAHPTRSTRNIARAFGVLSIAVFFLFVFLISGSAGVGTSPASAAGPTPAESG